MSTIDDAKIAAIVEAVVQRLHPELGGGSAGGGGTGDPNLPAGAAANYRTPRFGPGNVPDSPASPPYVTGDGRRVAPRHMRGRRGVFDDLDDAVAAARAAYEDLHWAQSLESRERIIASMRDAARRAIPELSHLAVQETKLGRVEDKIKKNTLAVQKTPGTEILRPVAWSGDDGLTVLERAPYGVIGSITPMTNPTETIICNSIGMIAGGNAVVFNVHPHAKQTSRRLVEILNDAIVAAGGPENLLSMVGEPTIESAQALMTHPGIRLLVVTGGGAVVKAAMQSGKRAICAGPGNPPAVIDDTADLALAARGLIDGASIDNNIICTCEKETIVTPKAYGPFLQQLRDTGAVFEVKGQALSRLEKTIITPDNHVNKEFVGKNARVILEAAGVQVSGDPRLAICEVDEDHPFVQHEQLMPVMPIVRAPDVHEAIEMARRVEHGFGHTAVMYSRDIQVLSDMARVINASIFVKNGPHLAGLGYGGEGHTSFTIASPTGEGLTTALSFTRERRCTLKDVFRFV